MLDDCLRLVTALEAMSAGRANAPQAEHRLVGEGTPHHVADPDGVLGLDPLALVPVRQALARLEHTARDGAELLGMPATGTAPVWALLLPQPGRLAGLRGPALVNRWALEQEAVVMTHDGSVCWLGSRVGAGVQWRLARAERPMPPTDPREAARRLAAVLTSAARSLTDLGITAGRRPDQVHPPVLGPGFDERNQTLLDRAWQVLVATDAALAAQHEVLHSHAVLTRERHLRELAGAARDAVSAAASWPSRALA